MSLSLKSCFATLPKTERGRSIVLGGDPKGKNFLYCHGNNVIIRDIENPQIVDIYSEHSREVSVAKYSPSGFYIASGDATGKVRIWDTVNKEHILKNEFPVLGGRIQDIDWDPESKRICLVGKGNERFGACITYDSGNNIGQITGHSKDANACSYKPTRPYRIVTASEDQSVIFLEGPPFKYSKTIQMHTNFVNCVKYAPQGEVFITGSSDKRALIFDGKTGDHTGELGSPAHNGGIYALSFNRDGSRVLTVSGDKTAKMWDVTTQQLITEFSMGKDLNDMQVGCLWQGDHILTVSLSGYINYLDINNPTSPIRIIKGHNKPITSLAMSKDRSQAYSGTMEGYINHWKCNTGESEAIKGKGHTNQVSGLVTDGDSLKSVGMDDTFRITSQVSNEYGSASSKMDSQPRGLASRNGTSVVACVKHVSVIKGEHQVSSMPAKYEPVCADIHPGMTEVAVGGDKMLVIYELDTGSGALREKKSIQLPECNVNAVRFSPDGAYLSEVGSDHYLRVYSCAEDYKEIVNSKAHNSRVCDVTWSPDSQYMATCSIDSSIAVFKPVQTLQNRVAYFKDAHYKSFPNKIEWVDNNTLITVGQDSCVKQWIFKN